MISVNAIDHFVLTVSDIQAACNFYSRVLGFGVVTFEDNRFALTFGHQQINLHLAGQEFDPKARHPGAGTADVCFTTGNSLEDWKTHLSGCKVDVLLGPVRQQGALGEMQSIYIRDPDGNLIEIAKYDRDQVETPARTSRTAVPR